jgi:hypothetical protein
MTNMPWGPHGQQAPAHSVTPNPTPSSVPQQIGGGGDYAVPMAAGGGGAGGGFLANVVFSLFMVALLWIPMACLYPLTAAAALIAGFGSFLVLVRALPADGHDVAVVAAFGIGVVVALVVDRVEYRLAQHPSFRLPRHIVRLALLAMWLVPIMQLSTGTTAPSTSTRFILAVMSHPGAIVSYLINPVHLVAWALLLAGLHLLIWREGRVREFWHRRLVYVGLK